VLASKAISAIGSQGILQALQLKTATVQMEVIDQRFTKLPLREMMKTFIIMAWNPCSEGFSRTKAEQISRLGVQGRAFHA